MKTIILILLLFVGLLSCSPDYPQPKKEVSFLVGTWVPEDTTFSTYVFNEDLTGQMTIERHWYNITYTYDGIQILKINWYGRINQIWLYDQTPTYFKMNDKAAYHKK